MAISWIYHDLSCSPPEISRFAGWPWRGSCGRASACSSRSSWRSRRRQIWVYRTNSLFSVGKMMFKPQDFEMPFFSDKPIYIASWCSWSWSLWFWFIDIYCVWFEFCCCCSCCSCCCCCCCFFFFNNHYYNYHDWYWCWLGIVLVMIIVCGLGRIDASRMMGCLIQFSYRIEGLMDYLLGGLVANSLTHLWRWRWPSCCMLLAGSVGHWRDWYWEQQSWFRFQCIRQLFRSRPIPQLEQLGWIRYSCFDIIWPLGWVQTMKPATSWGMLFPRPLPEPTLSWPKRMKDAVLWICMCSTQSPPFSDTQRKRDLHRHHWRLEGLFSLPVPTDVRGHRRQEPPKWKLSFKGSTHCCPCRGMTCKKPCRQGGNWMEGKQPRLFGDPKATTLS